MRRAVLAGVLLAALPAPAGAATRYVSPAGGAEGSCSRSAPCAAAHVLAGAGSAEGDTVIVLPGRYDEQPLVVARPLEILGRPDAPRPVFRLSVAGGVALTITPEAQDTTVSHLDLGSSGEDGLGVEVQAAATLSDLRVTSEGAPCLRSGATGVRIADSAFTLTGVATVPCLETTGGDTDWTGVRVTALNGDVAAVFAGSGTIADATVSGRLTGLVVSGTPAVHRVTAAGSERGLVLDEGTALVTDSVLIARQGGHAVLGREGRHALINVTAWGAGKGSTGVRALNGAELTVTNTIARGHEADLLAEPASTTIGPDCTAFAGCPAGRIRVTRSNFRTAPGVEDLGTNQSGSPRFVDAAFEDFRLRPGSPAVDAGSFELNASSADREGRFRWLGDSPDLGAYEYAPPRPLAPRSDRRAPVLRAVAMSTTRLRASRRGVAFTAAAKAPAGALLRWFLSERADVVLTLRRPGRDRPVLGTIVQPADLGWGAIRLSGELNAALLPPGRYVLRVMARDVTQNLSRPRDFVITVVR